MNTTSNPPLISICVPTYNGLPYISTLIDELLHSARSDFEIVISDDCSTDGTWDYVSGKSKGDPRVKCFRNAQNLGMDRNFAKTVAKANGKYVWLTGQDDRIFHQGIDAVAKCLLRSPEIDFIHLNYTRLEEGNSPTSEIKPLVGQNHFYGTGLTDFLSRTGGWLPTFLPLYIIRKNLWDAVDISYYFGTCFCQVGVFLESSEKMNWCHMDGNFVVGLTPVEGWQFKPVSYAKIVFGNYIMLHRAARRYDWLGPDFLPIQFKKILNQLVYSIILIRINKLDIDRLLTEELFDAIRPVFLVSFTARSLFAMPRVMCQFTMLLIKARRFARSGFNKIVKCLRTKIMRQF